VAGGIQVKKPNPYASPVTGRPICMDCGEGYSDCECPREPYEPDPDPGPTEKDEAVAFGGRTYP
jgi:hypothetical protein